MLSSSSSSLTTFLSLTAASLLIPLLPSSSTAGSSSLVALAQDGVATAGSTPANAITSYNCDPSKCKLPDCACASTDAPGGLKPEETPMFVVFTADDAIQSYTINAVNSFLAQRRNPNNCSVKMTYYTSLSYTNYSLVTEWYVAGNEIADHSMTHPEIPDAAEINGNLIALNSLAGIPLSSIQGFRAPYLNYSVELLTNLHNSGFTYDSSATSSSPVNATNTDAFWPYTLDNGLVNDCNSFEGICFGEPKLPGLWELPMYALFDDSGPNGIHLMDPWLDNPSTDFTMKFMQDTFTAHYNGKRQPFGLYTHPTHLATGYPGVKDPIDQINMLNKFIDWAQGHENVWIVSNEQLLAWVRAPVPISQMGSHEAFKCAAPQLPEGTKICNGMPGIEDGLLVRCPFNDFPFFTCYGCPVTPPTPANPNPEQNTGIAGAGTRYRLPGNCSTVFWDPQNGKCLAEGSFQDQSRPIGPNGTGFTGGGTSTEGSDSANSTATSKSPTYVPFSSAVPLIGNGGFVNAFFALFLGISFLAGVFTIL